MIHVQGIAEKGGVRIVTAGTSSTTRAIQSFPSSTITVYLTGTLTLATLYSDDGVTPKANPFTANTDASWDFYVRAGSYDIRFSGVGIATPFTLADVFVGQENTRIIFANDMPGAPDVGAQVTAADTLLGADSGIIYYFGGGNIATVCIVSEGHTLHLGAGTYTCDSTLGPVWMKSDTTLEGDGWGTIIEESTMPNTGSGREFVVISNYAQIFLNGSTQRNMIVRNLQIVGARSDVNSAQQAVQMGNCHGLLIENVHLEGTNAIGIQAGAVSTAGNDPLALGRYSENVTIRDCSFNRVASQHIAFVNTKNGLIADNFIMNPGQTGGPGVTPIDCEVNDFTNDKMEGIIIRGNICDSRNSELAPHGNFIAYQPATAGVGFEISDNLLIGGAKVSNGIITNACHQGIIAGNILIGCGQAGISLNGAVVVKVTDNMIVDCGTGGVPTVQIIGCDQVDFTDNAAYRTTSSANGQVDESGTCTNNTYQNNTLYGLSPRILASGVGDVVGANMIGGVWMFGSPGLAANLGPSFAGATSGSTRVQASTVAGATVLTLPAVTGVLAGTTGSNLHLADLKRCSASVTANGTITYANITGLSFTVVPGTYAFEINIASTVASGTGGIKFAFNYTTAVLSALEASGIGHTAAAVAVQHTTSTTTQADLFSQAAVVIHTRITGTMVVTTGGTVDVQMAQNTSNASNSIALIGSWARFTRIA